MLQVLIAISKTFCCRKETWGNAKVIHKKKKRKKRDEKKMNKYPRYLKQWVLGCPPQKMRRKQDE